MPRAQRDRAQGRRRRAEARGWPPAPGRPATGQQLMKLHFRFGLIALACLLSVSAGAQTQQYKYGIMPPGGPAPRTADGHPDLSGVWWPNRTGIPHVENQVEPGDKFGVDPAALRQFDARATPEERPS